MYGFWPKDSGLEIDLLPASNDQGHLSLTSPATLLSHRPRYATSSGTIISMLSRGSSSSKRTPVPRTTSSNPEHALDYVEELLYTSKELDTTSDLRRPRAASGSDLIADDQQAVTAQKHVYGQPCPYRNQECHYHHQLTQHCHIPWRHCSSACMSRPVLRSRYLVLIKEY